MQIKTFFDKATFTLSYVVYDEATKDAVIIDPVLDFDPASGRIQTSSVEEVIGFVRGAQLNVKMILETHAHADHLSSSQVLKREFSAAPLAIGAEIRKVQEVFKPIYGFDASFKTDGSQFDRLLTDGEVVQAGSLRFAVRSTPGHTPACSSYDFQGHLFTGDALFMPDYGVGRADFPGGSAETLFHSVKRLYQLPDATKVFTGHDYQPGGRPLRFESTIGEQKRTNVHIQAGTTLESFVKFRTERDATLAAPRLLHPSVQVNIDAGHLPKPNASGVSFLRIPLSGKVTM